MFDYWLRNFSQNYGWEQVKTKEELKNKLSQSQEGEIETGHALVVFSFRSLLFISQATINILASPTPEERKVNPKYQGKDSLNFWVHRLLEPYSPSQS